LRPSVKLRRGLPSVARVATPPDTAWYVLHQADAGSPSSAIPYSRIISTTRIGTTLSITIPTKRCEFGSVSYGSWRRQANHSSRRTCRSHHWAGWLLPVTSFVLFRLTGNTDRMLPMNTRCIAGDASSVGGSCTTHVTDATS